MEQSVPKRRYINFRRRGITQKKAYNMKSLNLLHSFMQQAIQTKKKLQYEEEANRKRVCGSEDEYLETFAVYTARFWYCKQET
jgi:hypothetical protein